MHSPTLQDMLLKPMHVHLNMICQISLQNSAILYNFLQNLQSIGTNMSTLRVDQLQVSVYRSYQIVQLAEGH